MRRKSRLVIDTNLVVSALLWGGKPLELLALAQEGEAHLYISPPLLAELERTIAKPKLARTLAASGRTAAEHIRDYRRLVTLMRRALPEGAWSRDPDDDRVIAGALAAKADFIVTGDVDLLTLGEVDGVRVVTVSDFLLMHA